VQFPPPVQITAPACGAVNAPIMIATDAAAAAVRVKMLLLISTSSATASGAVAIGG
jgi:hypothetical protein